jgi:protein involved in polysaccharide export with SLBB domain
MPNNEIRERNRVPELVCVAGRADSRATNLFRGGARTGKSVPLAVTARGLQRLYMMALLLICGVGAGHAQDTAVGFQATRLDLQNRLAANETALANSKLSSSRRKAVQAENAAIQSRLTNGDFKTGDLLVVTLNVEEKQVVDTATVRDNGMISITRVPDVSVAGVLRSEVREKVKAHIAQYFKQPDVRVNFTTRITIVGAVSRTGSYNISPDRQLTELVSIAGGGLPTAKLDQLEIRRSGKIVLAANASKRALIEGKTLEQVGVQPGDEVVVPAKRTFNWQAFAQIAFLISSLAFALINFLQYYYSEE